MEEAMRILLDEMARLAVELAKRNREYEDLETWNNSLWKEVQGYRAAKEAQA